MAFRRPRESSSWSALVRAHAELAVRAGIPAWVREDQRFWDHLLQSGYTVDMQRSLFFSVEQLDEQQVDALIDLLLAMGVAPTELQSCIPRQRFPAHRTSLISGASAARQRKAFHDATAPVPAEFQVAHAYAPRKIRFARIRESAGWRLKEYEISLAARFDGKTFADGVTLALGALPQPPVTEHRPGVGFLIQHQGRGANYVVIAWWDNENELPLHVYVREHSAAEPGRWRPARSGESVCVWDLDVINFERNAYIDTVLNKAAGDVEAYLAKRMAER